MSSEGVTVTGAEEFPVCKAAAFLHVVKGGDTGNFTKHHKVAIAI